MSFTRFKLFQRGKATSPSPVKVSSTCGCYSLPATWSFLYSDEQNGGTISRRLPKAFDFRQKSVGRDGHPGRLANIPAPDQSLLPRKNGHPKHRLACESGTRLLMFGGLPFPPMRGRHVEPLCSSLFYPTANDTLTWKQKGMRPVPVDHRQFKIAAEGGCYYWLPHFVTFDVKPHHWPLRGFPSVI